MNSRLDSQGERQLVELQITSRSKSADPWPLTCWFRTFRGRVRLERLLPVGLGEPVRATASPNPAIRAMVEGETQLPARPGAARDGVEALLLDTLPRSAFNLLEQANAMRVWRDFLRKFQRTATLASGQEATWAAAVEYVLRVLESRPGSQQGVARSYGVSPVNLASHARLIESTLRLQQLDPRYTLSPDRGALGMAALRRSLGLNDRLPLGAGRGRSYRG